MMTALLTQDFDYFLPEDLIAAYPAEPRDSSRLLLYNERIIADLYFRDIINYFSAGDLIIFNNSKVINARLFGYKGEKRIEFLLHKALAPDRWLAFARPARKLNIGDEIFFAHNFSAQVAAKQDNGQIELLFLLHNNDLFELLDKYGHVPLPPYIKREDVEEDKSHYQPIYAHHPGSVAAPTAGLHFTEELLHKLEKKGILIDFITLHVGGGTFLPVKTEKITDHIMHSELFHISAKTANLINDTKARGNKVIAVGTTSLRALEASSQASGKVEAYFGETDIFITPGFEFNIVDKLVTNFHLPKSTLLMLVAAFVGMENMQNIYKHAIDKRYRFYSYGDACLLNLK